ncbi:hypothetical protein M433DRAFT_7927 [Acidomyces richmondensis BFW]|nr:hypothetical protein M433DRAFT_7927 [Acidomyces richmondensis BFW]
MSDILDTSVTGGREFKIPTITAVNFEDWLDLVKTVLLSKGLWKYATGSIVSTLGKDEDFEKEDAKAAVLQDERLLSLCSPFHGFKAEGGIDPSANKLTLLQQEIAAIGESEKPTDSMKKTVLLRSLSLEYQSTIFALKAAGLLKITFDDRVQRLKETEVGLKGQELPQDKSLARVAGHSRKSFEKMRQGQKDKKDKECF